MWQLRTGGLLGGLFLAVVTMAFVDIAPGQPEVTRMAAVALLMATWWITEALPIPVTALVPIVAFPVLGIMSGKAAASQYAHSNIYLFLGGFLIALAMERWNLHRRLALTIIHRIGRAPERIILGFMVATAFLSMWISNTATSMMMLPIALSVLKQVPPDPKKPNRQHFAFGLLMAIAYGASIGGIATLIGTPPNISLSRNFAQSFPDLPPISFAQWMLFGLPYAVVFLAVTWALLVYVFAPCRGVAVGGDTVKEELDEMGAMTTPERRVMVVFVGTALLWMLRRDLDVGVFALPGWSRLLPYPGLIDDGTVAIFAAILLFALPAGVDEKKLLNWETALRVPWGILLLFGGGLALAGGFRESGLSQAIGEVFVGFPETAPVVLVGAVALMITFLTELTSNTATTEMILPILAGIAGPIGVHPLVLMIPAAVSASCAFMLPVATPPNAIVFGSGEVSIARMAKVGLVLNLIGVALTCLAVLLVAWPVFGLSSG